MVDLIKEFELQLNKISDIDYVNIIKSIFTKYDLHAVEKPSSSSLKYHPLNKDGEPETIIQHTKRVFLIAWALVNHPDVTYQVDKSLVLASCLCHDLVKYGYPNQDNEHTQFEHPVLLKFLNPGSECNQEKFKLLCDTVATHHGPWRTHSKSSVILPKIENINQWYVHLSDFIASRSYIGVDYDYDFKFN